MNPPQDPGVASAVPAPEGQCHHLDRWDEEPICTGGSLHHLKAHRVILGGLSLDHPVGHLAPQSEEGWEVGGEFTKEDLGDNNSHSLIQVECPRHFQERKARLVYICLLFKLSSKKNSVSHWTGKPFLPNVWSITYWACWGHLCP